MARKRMENSIKGWDGVDEALRAIGQIDREIEEYEAMMQKDIADAKAAAVIASKPLQARKKELERQMQVFVLEHRPEIKGKTRQVNFGVVGFRWSSKITLPKGKGIGEQVAKLLEKMGHEDCVRTKKSPNKEKMKGLDDATLTQVGAKKAAGDVFWYEVNRERVQEAA